jgi:phosphoserine phosphatase
MNLIAQRPGLAKRDVDELCRLVDRPAERITAGAIRFRNCQPDKGIPAWCDEKQIDHAYVPAGRRFADLKLLAMDMDSTLITIECIDELGDLAGRKAEVAAVTEQAMRGEIDYPESLKRRVAAIAGLAEKDLLRVYKERLRLTPGAEALLSACVKHGVQVLLVSGGFTFFTERLKARLGLHHTISNVLEVKDGKLTGALVGAIVDAQAKARKFIEIKNLLGARREQTLAIGDGANDLKMMAEAGLSVAYRAKPVVRAQAGCALNWSGLDAVVNLLE